MTRTRKIYVVLMSLVVAAAAVTALTLLGINDFNVRAQTTPATPAPTGLSNLGGPQCGATGERGCTAGTVFLVNAYSRLTTSSQAASGSYARTGGNDLQFNRIVTNAAYGGSTGADLTYVGDNTDLFATYIDRGTVGSTPDSPLNPILTSSDTLIVAVSDTDQIQRTGIVFGAGTSDNTFLAGMNFLPGALNTFNISEMAVATPGTGTTPVGDVQLPIIDNNPSPGLASNLALADDVSLYISTDAIFDQSTDILIGSPVSVFQTIDSSGDRTATILANIPTGATGSLFITWDTPALDSTVIVQVNAGFGLNAYVQLKETDPGTGLFVGEVILVANTQSRSDDYIASLETGTVVTITKPASATPVLAGQTGANTQNYTVFDGTANRLSLPVRDSSSITVRYSDKTDSTGSGNTLADVFATRTATARVDRSAPAVTVIAPEHNAAISSRTPDFNGTASDSGSGLDVSSLRLIIHNDPSGGATPILSGSPNTNGNIPATTASPAVAIDSGTGTNVTRPTPRVLSGTENSTSGLYANRTNYEDGASAVEWLYETPRGQELYNASSDVNNIDIATPYRVQVLDIAGNIGYSDADDTMDGVDDFIINIDLREPGLIDPATTQATISFLVASASRDVRIFNVLQTGVTWANDQLIPSANTIMLVFDDPLVNVDISDFTVDFSTSGVANPNVTSFIQPGRVSPSLFRDVTSRANCPATTANNVTTYGGDCQTLATLLLNSVFIVLSTDIPAADKPTVTVTGVQDAAGNGIDSSRDSFDALDGLGPQITVTFSGGSGTGSNASGTGPATLTRQRLDVTITSNEQGNRPRVQFYYSDDNGVTSSRSGSLLSARPVTTSSWEYSINGNLGSGSGLYCVVVTLADSNANTTTAGTDDCGNNNALSFTYDRTAPALEGVRLGFATPLPGTGSQGTVTFFEQRPSIQIPLDTVVRPDSLIVRLEDVLVPSANISTTDNQVFVFNPAADLTVGDYKISWRATDLAGNQSSFRDFTVTISQRTDFRLQLSAGWNLVSFPSAPLDGAINSVFSDASVTRVNTLDTSDFRNIQMRTATRSNTTGSLAGTLNQLQVGSAYWVFSTSFANVDVALTPPAGAGINVSPTPVTIPTVPGVNFVGVVDPSNQQTQQYTSETARTLQRFDGQTKLDVVVSVNSYFGGVSYSRVYTYDTTNRRFVELNSNATLLVGQGLLVFITPNANGSTNPIFP